MEASDAKIQLLKDLMALATDQAGTPEGEAAATRAASIMARYAIDEAMVRNSGTGPVDITDIEIVIPGPFSRVRVFQAADIASIFGVAAVLLPPDRHPYFKKRSIWGLACFGPPDACDNLQSLLALLWVQLDTAVARAERDKKLTTKDRVGVITGFLSTVAKRLRQIYNATVEEAETATPGAALALREAVSLAEEARTTAFPDTKSVVSRRKFGADGFASGAADGQRADIGQTKTAGADRAAIEGGAS